MEANIVTARKPLCAQDTNRGRGSQIRFKISKTARVARVSRVEEEWMVSWAMVVKCWVPDACYLHERMQNMSVCESASTP